MSGPTPPTAQGHSLNVSCHELQVVNDDVTDVIHIGSMRHGLGEEAVNVIIKVMNIINQKRCTPCRPLHDLPPSHLPGLRLGQGESGKHCT